MSTPSTIFHYTTIAGLIGIVTKRELWASDYQFLSDGMELSYARDIFFAEVKKLKLSYLGEEGGYRVAGSSLAEFRVFIACFCEDGDLLSQWTGYGADQGYALGFDTAKFQSLNLGEFTSVQYGITDPSAYFAEELETATQPTAHPGVEEWHSSESLLPRLVRVKHPGFAEEREWRLLKQVWSIDETPGIQFRPSPMGPVPYIVHTFPAECIREIILGPGSYTSARKAAVEGMLRYCGFKGVAVLESKIPFRR